MLGKLGERSVRLAVGALALAWLGVYFVPASGAVQGSWVNHDHDNWSGWADPSSPGYATNPQGCDPLVPQQCMLPYPDDWLTSYDPTSLTGRKLNLNPLAMPRNAEGKPIDPSSWNDWSDGFSAGAQILTVLPGVTKNADLVASGIPTDTSMSANAAPDTGVILLDADTGQTWPVWAEVDQYTSEAGLLPAGAVGSVQQDLMIHPAENLLDGHRYIVALRHVHADDGTVVAPSPAFKAYRDGTAGSLDPRTAHMNGIFADLSEAGWARSDLYLAWDFTTASTESVTSRLVSMRNDALGQLGQTTADMKAGVVTPSSKAPAFTVSSVADYTTSQNPYVAREITGTFTVPCYVAPTCSPPVKCETLTAPTPAGTPFDDCPSPGEFALDPTNLYATPSQVPGQTYQAGFICIVGQKGWGTALMRPVEYGHGLFGSDSEVTASPQEEMAGRFGMMYCATDWFGFADADIPNAVLALSDLSNFSLLIDRTLQGELNFLYLQRLMIHPDGFASNGAFRYPGSSASFIDTSDVYYDGNSQGGIYGGTVCAISVDVKHCSLGVPGMDYAVLLPRSSDYVATSPLGPSSLLSITPSNPTGGLGYSNLFDLFYPDQSERQLTLDLIQTLWDRADPNGYATHMTSTASGGLLPDTPDHQVLMQVAWGDHQVADVTAEDEARSIGAATFAPALDPSRLCGGNDPSGAYCYSSSDPSWGLPAITSDTYPGSAMVFFDAGPVGADQYGTDPPPPSDVPNFTGGDPHEAPRRACAAQEQKSDFMAADGLVTLVAQPPSGLAPPPYFSGGWQGTCALS
ncbi:MAG TPA: hypothetical protein VNF71_01935 [Acidimicrobiales bacterium]|nr:hypothetical protein [Acidimicrobiales bacterium]